MRISNNPLNYVHFCVLFLWIGTFLVCSTKKIVYTDIVEIGKYVQGRDRDVQPAKLVVRVGGLVDLQKCGQIFLL